MFWSKIVRNLVFEKRSIRHISIAIHLMWRLANGLDNAGLVHDKNKITLGLAAVKMI